MSKESSPLRTMPTRFQDPEKKRDHCVSVRLNPEELAYLDEARGRMRRGEAVRVILFQKKPNLPRPIPPINAELRSELGRALGNLSTLAGMSRGGEYVKVQDVQSLVADLRAKLIGGLK